MKRLYDNSKKRLIYISSEATPDYWDKLWEGGIENAIRSCKRSFVTEWTKRYLKNGKVLEGGCGNGKHVNALMHNGFESYGIDYAKKTVKVINEYAPNLKVVQGDVRDIPFNDNEFAGYWSIGVIEHFWEGYNEILKEMNRVIKPEGYLFITFPAMNKLRKIKAGLGLYDANKDERLDGFYQFALSHESVVRDLEVNGFQIKKISWMDGTKGLKDELPILRAILQYLYDSGGKVAKMLMDILNIVSSNFAGHSCIIVAQKIKKTDE